MHASDSGRARTAVRSEPTRLLAGAGRSARPRSRGAAERLAARLLAGGGAGHRGGLGIHGLRVWAIWPKRRVHAARPKLPLCRQKAAGATGLEPATSGVTGRADRNDGGRRSTRIACKCGTSEPIWDVEARVRPDSATETFGPQPGHGAAARRGVPRYARRVGRSVRSISAPASSGRADPSTLSMRHCSVTGWVSKS